MMISGAFGRTGLAMALVCAAMPAFAATHTVVIDGHPWMRTGLNRGAYVHPYVVPRPAPAPRIERHELRPTLRPNREHTFERKR